MTIDERALPERVTWPSIPVGAGEVFEIHDPKQAAELSYRCRVLKAELSRMQTLADEVLRDTLAEQAATALRLDDLEVTEKTGTPSYDADEIYNGLVAAGMSPAAAESLFYVERKVADGKELNKLANRHDGYAKVIVAGTKRRRGSLSISRKRQHVATGQIPEAVHKQAVDEARSTREAEAEADELGI